MTGPLEDIDSKVDWLSFYSRYLDRVNKSGENMNAECPFAKHTNRQALSVSTKDGRWQCFACEATGNAYSFLQKSQGMSKEQAVETVMRAAGVVELASRGGKKPEITVEQYAAEKKLPVEFLRELGIKTGRNKGWVSIPYYTASGEVQCTRKRMPKSHQSRFMWASGASGKTMPYGVNRIASIETDRVILVEGESDCHTLWHRGYNDVVGIPGSKMLKPEWVKEHLFMYDSIWLHIEPGKGGKEFLEKCCRSIAETNYPGKVRTFTTVGAKDPSDLHCDKGDEFDKYWKESLDGAQTINPVDFAEASSTNIVIPGAPVSLSLPDGYVVSNTGITASSLSRQGDVVEEKICPVPILISRRLRSIDTGDEKIELTYLRDGTWHSISAKRSMVFTARTIVELADRGLPVSSERSKKIVKYLDALEASNLDTLPKVRSVERMGWVGSGKFMPSMADDVVLDPPPGSEYLADAYHEHGDFDEWKTMAIEARERFPLARFMLSASFAATLLKQLRQRVMILHFWGPSRSGKTAAMKLALSAWGNADDLMATFNTTKVGMERLAGFYNDLPLGVDERQVIGRDQNLAEGLVYMLGAGKGKVRGAKQGGLQATQSWRTIALTTGEEPLSGSSSHTGVKSRALEIYGIPVDDEDRAGEIHRTIDRNYGHAGPAFVKALVAYEGDIDKDFEAMAGAINSEAPEHMKSHLSSVATIAVADAYSSMWLFGLSKSDALAQALSVARTVISGLDTADEADYSNRAVEWMEGWLSKNRDRFTGDARDPYGFLGGSGCYWIEPNTLENAMQEDGFVSRRVLRDLRDSGRLVLEDHPGGGKKRLKVRKTWNGNRVWMVGYLPEGDPVAQSELAGPGEVSQWWNRD